MQIAVVVSGQSPRQLLVIVTLLHLATVVGSRWCSVASVSGYVAGSGSCELGCADVVTLVAWLT
ncbi:hypothetical protein GN958_ATG00922 [Phytophthora infestans]|uniref:Uncharacterized protein n=1 Tax=Phytophthora infestans TaxID=4787 RepID=A0A8S9VBD4_PHYIN|nr:hypothetical protein GN958_ATG00922 [Phytophthora infestans]